MSGKIFKAAALFAAIVCAAGCSEGSDNNLTCDAATYESECVSGQHYMTCRDGVIQTIVCDTGKKCVENTSVGPDNKPIKTADCR